MWAVEKQIAIAVPSGKGILIGRISMTKNAWEKPNDCINKKQGRDFSTTEHIISYAQFEGIECFNNTFVDPFVVSCN